MLLNYNSRSSFKTQLQGLAIKQDDGVIKFNLNLKKAPLTEEKEIFQLEKWRALFFKMGLIGEYPTTNIGFGNLSTRLVSSKTEFIITGSQTGAIPHLQKIHYAKVTEADLNKQQLSATGLIMPSSESLTHYAIYDANKSVQAIFHVHHAEFWQKLIANNYPTIKDSVSYGTQEMAKASAEFAGSNSSMIFAMKGHEDGVLCFGKSLDETGKLLLETFRKLMSSK